METHPGGSRMESSFEPQRWFLAQMCWISPLRPFLNLFRSSPCNWTNWNLNRIRIPCSCANHVLIRCITSSSEHVLYSIIDPPSLCENRTSSVPINNSFNGLIPYVYDREDNVPCGDCMDRSMNEDNYKENATNENFHEAAIEDSFVSPTLARHKKREAKMLFSGSRPKGRHRSWVALFRVGFGLCWFPPYVALVACFFFNFPYLDLAISSMFWS